MKKMCVALAALLVAGVLCACSDRKEVYALTFAEAERLNEHSDFGEYELLQESSQEVIEEYKASGSGYFHIFDKDGNFLLRGDYSPYPYDSDTLRLTQIFVDGTDVHVYGIQIGNTLEKGYQSLLELGYTEEGRGQANIAMQKDNIDIDIIANVTTLRIYQINIAVRDPFTPDPLSQSQADYSFHRDEVYALAQELNDNSDFGGLSLTGFIPKNLRSKLGYEPFVMDFFSTENVEATYYEFDYDYRLMDILLQSDAYHLLGVKVGDSVADAGEKLAAFGYEFTGEDDSDVSEGHYYFYGKGEYALSYIHLITKPNSTEIVSIFVGLSDNYEQEFLGAY